MKRYLLVLFVMLSFSSVQAAEKLSVMTSVKPLQLVAQAIVGDLGEVNVLLPDGSSPHYYALRPSEVRALNNVDLLIWVGPELEAFLSKPVKQLPIPVLQLLDGMEDEGHEGHEEVGHEDHDHHHHHEGLDPHIWLDPELMLDAARSIQQQLTQMHPSLKETLQANYEVFATSLAQQDELISQQLAPYQKTGFVVFHDAFSRFVEHYGLNQVAAFTLDPSRPSGAKTVAHIRQLIKAKKAHCVFAEPQFKAGVLKRVVEGEDVNVGTLDPLAISLNEGATYTDYLQLLADSVSECLAE